MTDDSAAERGSLADVWPLAVLLLCIFHFLSNEWTFLLSNCKKKDRRRLMKMFYEVI
jgi:hypothetical protein